MKRILPLALLAFAVPLVPGPAALGQTATAPAGSCPSDAPIAPPMGDVDQFVAFDPDGCPVPATVGITAVASSSGPVVAAPTPAAPVEEAPASPVPVAGPEGADPRPAVIVTIPVEDGFVVTTGEAEAEAAARPKPADYSQRLDADYCAAVPWKCDSGADSFNG